MIDLEDFLHNKLLALYNDGATDHDIAERAGIRQAHINRLRHGKAPMGRVAVQTIARLFPDVQRAITSCGHGGNVAIDHSIAGHTIALNTSAPDLDAYRGRLCMALAGLGLDADALARVMGAIRETR